MKWWQIFLNSLQSHQAIHKATRGEAKGASICQSLSEGQVEGSSAPYRFDVLAQLANILARITLYELLRLSKSTREALRGDLADAEVFMTQISAEP